MRLNKRRTWKIAVVMVLGITALSTIGFSSWAVVQETSVPTAAIHMNGTEVIETIPGISITSDPLKLGTYFYEEGSGNTADNTTVGYLKYTFEVTPTSLPSDFKVSENNYSFSLSGTITFSNKGATDLFKTDFVQTNTVVSNVSTGTTVTAPTLNPVSVSSESINLCSASISSFTVTITSTAVSHFTLGIGFTQKLLLSKTDRDYSYRDLLLGENAKFTLRLTGGATHD